MLNVNRSCARISALQLLARKCGNLQEIYFLQAMCEQTLNAVLVGKFEQNIPIQPGLKQRRDALPGCSG